MTTSAMAEAVLRSPASARSGRRPQTYFCLLLVFVTMPIYLLPSGGLQVVDFAVGLLGLSLLFPTSRWSDSPLEMVRRSPGLQVVFFTIWVVSVNAIYLAINLDTGFLAPIIQQSAALVIFSVGLSLSRVLLSSARGVSFMYWVLLAGSMTPYFVNSRVESLTRDTASFNNPNQAAYFATLMYAILLLIDSLRRHISGARPNPFAVIACRLLVIGSAHYLPVVGASRAGVAAALILDVAYFLTPRPHGRKTLALSLIVLLGVGVVAIREDLATTLASGTLARRVAAVDLQREVDKRVVEKIPDSFNDSPLIPLVGTGKDRSIREIHNGFINILVTTGVIGTLLFSMVIWAAVSRVRLVGWRDALFYGVVIGAVALFNFVHNGFRFRLFWIFLAILHWTIGVNALSRSLEPERVRARMPA